MATKKSKTEETMEGMSSFFTKAMEEQTAQMETFTKEWQKWTQKGASQFGEAMEDVQRLMQSNLKYSLELQGKMQEQFVDGARQVMEGFSSK